MRERIAELAKEIKSTYDSLREKARAARSSNPSLILKVQRAPISLSVCAVDGGLLAQRMHGADIVVSRAVAVIFDYKDSNLRSCIRFPSKSPAPDIEMKNSLEEHEAVVFRSLVRLKQELACAIAVLEKYQPKILLMDGSLVPLPSDRPAEDSELRPLYGEVIKLYGRLYDLSKTKNCILCGVIKDSRSKKLSKQLGMDCSDTLLCNFFLDEGERTEAMGYFEGKPPNPDVASLGERIKIFYIKPSRNDLPLRVETMDADADYVASVIGTLSAISENFAYPAVLIEADMCAALDPSEMESIESSLLSLSGMKPLRRNTRPFR